MSVDSEKGSENAPPKPPVFAEGGLKAWCAVVSCWCIMFNTFGYINAFGIYQSYYSQNLLQSESESNLAWIGSIQVFFMFSGGLIAGPLMDRYGPKIIVVPCSVLFVLSVMLTSLCHEYYQFMLAQGVLGGLMNGLTYTPTVTAVNQYFFKRRPIAMGISSSGSSLAGVIFPIALNRLLNHSSLGFGWSVRVVGFIMLAMCLVASVTVSSPAPRRKAGPLILIEAWKNPGYTIQNVGIFLLMWGMFTPFFYIPGYSISIGIGVDLSNYLIAILNAASLFGRLLGGAISNKFGRSNVMFFSSTACGILILGWLAIKSLGGMIVFSILYGFFSGSFIGLFPSMIAMAAPKPNMIGTYVGMAMGFLGIAGLTGTPITGAMINSYGTYTAAIIFSGVVCLGGSALLLVARFIFFGPKLIA
ncbi:putative MFS monocarboxylate transporter [Talaromyces proteolyticus]|uniref:MFS monocarboxylate transporter n=1 Tax=Talaromyces proteolyticus TaxID=1131652 RepID=A0AAD4Q1H0_9EURO|nr:putative MFS monocarboxylate transporter [Talaromyces proteolyticus]KAH8705640.1 putative MFS monocarboxylate transporter [Talaromyces proteolyticus]